MNVIILSGGAGKRLWPVSNHKTPKQFLPAFEHAGKKESMIQRTYRMLRAVSPDANIVFATEESQQTLLQQQIATIDMQNAQQSDLRKLQTTQEAANTNQEHDTKLSACNVNAHPNICIEPCRKNTFPAISLATLYMRDVKHIDDNEPVIVCPADAYADKNFYETFNKMADHIQNDTCNLTLCGIKPIGPNSNYGYIIPKAAADIAPVAEFKEKPDAQTAKILLKKNALWNSGVFAFKIKYLATIIKKITGQNNYNDLLQYYDELDSISFDYAVCEKENQIDVCKYDGEWKDTGTWNSLSEIMKKDSNNNIAKGQAKLSTDCKNATVINMSNIPVVVNDLKNVVVAVSDEGVYVSSKDKSDNIKNLLEE